MNAKKGQVSDVYGDDQTGRLIAVSLLDIYDNGYVPVTDNGVRDYVAAIAENDKKAAKIIADYQGKANSVAEYAKLMNTDVDTTKVTFGQRAISGFALGESDLAAAVATAQKGQLVGPMQSNSAVVVFVVNDIDKSGREFNFDTDKMRFNQQQAGSILARNLFNIMLGGNKVENNLLQFYQD